MPLQTELKMIGLLILILTILPDAFLWVVHMDTLSCYL